ncbi:hypothetical protein L2735_17455 [Shewanella olleyana]|uniref:hypothetical protein n=1 Tax=Shewanella olleyana TaxID=135626 RepID=UPI00200D35EE|nr:hypothetical protein [Shewanella olleyana]MCL1068561.1 hypothetical protein [Shewanella olleyana]
MAKSLVSTSFTVPLIHSTEHFYFTPLNEDVAELDYEAVMFSQQSLQGIFGPHSNWPELDMTLEQNIISLNVHKQEFKTRTAFAYSVLNLEQTKCLGSIYIDPSDFSQYQCVVHFWIRSDSIEQESILFQTIKNWLNDEWNFTQVAFPGRTISWQDWLNKLL